MVYFCEELTSETQAEAERFREELGILGDGLIVSDTRYDEYPQVTPMAQRQPNSGGAGEKAKRKARRRALMATASRRRKRRK